MASARSDGMLECRVCEKMYEEQLRKVRLFPSKICSENFTQDSSLSRDVRMAGKGVNDQSFTCEICMVPQPAKEPISTPSTERKPLPCFICNKIFAFKGKLYRHVARHASSKPCICGICGKTFDKSITTAKHIEAHFKENSSCPCRLCSRTFSNKANLLRHLLNSCDQLSLTCFVCKENFRNRSEIISHLKTHDEFSDDVYVGNVLHKTEKLKKDKKRCPTFNKSFEHRSKLDHNKKKCHECNVCDRQFKQRCHLGRHMKLKHTTNKCFYCQLCNRGFVDNVNFIRHEKTHRKVTRQIKKNLKAAQVANCKKEQELKVEPFVNNDNEGNIAGERSDIGQEVLKCSLCEEQFMDSLELDSHTKIHGRSVLSESYVCDRNSSPTAKSMQHETVHIIDEPVTSNPTEKLINNENKNKIINKRVAGSKKFECCFCHKGFTHEWNLRSHVALLHSEEESYSCKVCHHKFYRKWMLVRHMATHATKHTGYDDEVVEIFDTSKLTTNTATLTASIKKGQSTAVPSRKDVSQDKTSKEDSSSNPQLSNHQSLDRKLSLGCNSHSKRQKVPEEGLPKSAQLQKSTQKDIDKRLSGDMYQEEAWWQEFDELPDPSDMLQSSAQGFDRQVSKHVQKQKTIKSKQGKELLDHDPVKNPNQQEVDREPSVCLNSIESMEQNTSRRQMGKELPDLTSHQNQSQQEKSRVSSVCLNPTDIDQQKFNSPVSDDLQRISSEVPSQAELQEQSELLLTTDMANGATFPSDVCQKSSDRTKDQNLKEILQAVKLFNCNVCKLELNSKETLVEHLRFHNAKEIYNAYLPNESQNTMHRSLKRRFSHAFLPNLEEESSTRALPKQSNLENTRLQSSITLANSKPSEDVSCQGTRNVSLNAKMPRYDDSQKTRPPLAHELSEQQEPWDKRSSKNNVSNQPFKTSKQKKQFTCRVCKKQFHCRITFHKHCKLHPEWNSFSYRESIEEVVLRIRKVKNRKSTKKNMFSPSCRVQRLREDSSYEKNPVQRTSSLSIGSENGCVRSCRFDKGIVTTAEGNSCICNKCSNIIPNLQLEKHHHGITCSAKEQLFREQINHEQLDTMRTCCDSEYLKNRLICRARAGRGNKTSRNRLDLYSETGASNLEYCSVNEGCCENRTDYMIYKELGNGNFASASVGPYECYKCKVKFARENLCREHELECLISRIQDGNEHEDECPVGVYSSDNSHQMIIEHPREITQNDFDYVKSNYNQGLESESPVDSGISSLSPIQDDYMIPQSEIDCIPKTEEVKCEVTENFYYKESTKEIDPVGMHVDGLLLVKEAYEAVCVKVTAPPNFTDDSLMVHSCWRQSSLNETTVSCDPAEKIISCYEHLVIDDWMAE